VFAQRYGLRFRDLLRHCMIIGATGSGKSSVMLRMIDQLMSAEAQKNHPCSAILLDPHGDAAMELARSLPDLTTKAIVLDPHFVNFSLNPLELSPYRTEEEKKRQISTRIGELKIYLADVMRSDPERASRLSWIFTGNLHYLYSKGDNPTFRDLYFLVSDESWMDKHDIRSMLVGGGLDDKTIEKTLEGILALRGEAFPPLLNRLARFVLPADSLVARTFCSRKSTIHAEDWLEPGKLTIIRIPKIHDIPEDFRELLAASVVLSVYFAVQSRASRLEEEGRDPSSRSPVFFFIDEFQTIERLQTLEVILSEARKFGLSLILANQYTSQLSNRSLLDAIAQNAGVIMVGGVSGEDARFFGRILGQDFERVLEENTTGRFSVRIRPYEVGTTARTERWLISLAPGPVRPQDAVIQYMRTEMEKRYGGASEDKTIIYRQDQMKVMEEAGKPKLSPLRYTILCFLYYNSGNEYMCTDDQLNEYITKKHGWNSVQINRALSDLMEYGYVTSRTGFLETIMKGRDKETGQPIYGEPTTQDEKERARVVIYSLTKQAIDEFFTLKVHSARAGSALHLLVIRQIVDEYRKLSCWCTVDTGEFKRQRPDILVFKRDMREKGSDVWDYESALPIEVETNPRKHRDGVIENYEKNVRNLMAPLFVVTLPEHRDDIHEILHDKEPGSYRVAYRDVGLDRDRVLELDATADQAAAAAAEQAKPEERIQAKESVDMMMMMTKKKKEVEIFDYWKEHGRPVMDEAYRRKLLDDPNWKDDPIWRAAERKALARPVAGPPRPGPESQQKEQTEEEPAPVAEQPQAAPVQVIEEEEEQPQISPEAAPAAVEQPEEAQRETEPTSDRITQPSDGSAQIAEQPQAELVQAAGGQPHVSPAPTGVVQSEARPETASASGQTQTTTPPSSSPDDEPPAPASEGVTIRLSKAALKTMLFTLKAVSEGKHTTAEVSAELGISQRQAERYLNELIRRGCVFREQKKYFLTGLGEKILQGKVGDAASSSSSSSSNP